jgi:cytoskeletal protein CcmA (bactofilin family)
MQQESDVNTVVGSSVHLTGSLKDPNDIIIHGSVEGEVASQQNVVIAENAVVKGPVSAKCISVSGYINGTIVAEDKLEIHPSGRVSGNIKARDLIIHSGAQFVGESEMPIDEKDAIAPEITDDAETTSEEEEVTTMADDTADEELPSINIEEDDEPETAKEDIELEPETKSKKGATTKNDDIDLEIDES